MKTITFDDLIAKAKADPALAEALTENFDDEPGAPDGSNTRYMLTETACYPLYVAALNNLGFSWTDTAITYDPAQLEAVRDLAGRIMDDYDGDNDSGSWDEFELGGDDSVDYCGGFILCFTDALKHLESSAAL